MSVVSTRVRVSVVAASVRVTVVATSASMSGLVFVACLSRYVSNQRSIAFRTSISTPINTDKAVITRLSWRYICTMLGFL